MQQKVLTQSAGVYAEVNMDVVETSQKGAANGVAPLNASSQLEVSYLASAPGPDYNLVSGDTGEFEYLQPLFGDDGTYMLDNSGNILYL